MPTGMPGQDDHSDALLVNPPISAPMRPRCSSRGFACSSWCWARPRAFRRPIPWYRSAGPRRHARVPARLRQRRHPRPGARSHARRRRTPRRPPLTGPFRGRHARCDRRFHAHARAGIAGCAARAGALRGVDGRPGLVDLRLHRFPPRRPSERGRPRAPRPVDPAAGPGPGLRRARRSPRRLVGGDGRPTAAAHPRRRPQRRSHGCSASSSTRCKVSRTQPTT